MFGIRRRLIENERHAHGPYVHVCSHMPACRVWLDCVACQCQFQRSTNIVRLCSEAREHMNAEYMRAAASIVMFFSSYTVRSNMSPNVEIRSSEPAAGQATLDDAARSCTQQRHQSHDMDRQWDAVVLSVFCHLECRYRFKSMQKRLHTKRRHIVKHESHAQLSFSV